MSVIYIISGYLMWINYLGNSSTPPPPINTIKPVPINPKDIWENLLTIDGVAAEIKAAQQDADDIVEMQADLEKDIISSTNVESMMPNANIDADSSDSDADDEYVKAIKILRQSKSVKQKDAQKKAKKNKTLQARQVVINAVAGIKAAAKYMLDKKLETRLVKFDNRSAKQLGHDAFWKKIVSIEDVEFFKSRTTVEDILNRVDDEIKKSQEFEWLPKRVLSEEQQSERIKREAQHAEQYSRYSVLWKTLLCRPKESILSEVVGRSTTEDMQKRLKKEEKKKAASKPEKAAPKPPKEKQQKSNKKTDDQLIGLQKQVDELTSLLKLQHPTENSKKHIKKRKEPTYESDEDSPYLTETTHHPRPNKSLRSSSNYPQHIKHKNNEDTVNYFVDTTDSNVSDNNNKKKKDNKKKVS